MAGNFYVALAVYLQIMAKPLHVKFILIFLPIFSFVGLGFTHSVADMFVLTMGLVNGSSHSVGEIAWKVFLPGALGNMIGGTFFGIVIPWYSHIYSVEQDQRLLNLPQYELRDEQPEINSDSRVVRERRRVSSAIIDEKPKTHSTDISGSTSVEQFSPPQGLYDDTSIVSDSSHARSLSRVATGASLHSRHTSLRSRSHSFRSPKNVFPVYGMGEPLERERTIASGKYEDAPEPMTDDGDVESERSAEFVGTRIKRILSRPPHTDLEHQRSHTKSVSSRRTKPTLRQYSISSQRSYRSNSSAYRNRMYNAGIPPSAMVNSDFVAGVASGTPSPSYTPVLAPATRVRRASTEPGSMGISGSGSIPKRTDSNVSPNHSSEDITDLSRLASL
ncbi:hypothetical protein CANTEDRAFT_95131 [Yamadazyma tenuis ATCC 10573]|nr:uncharacterized protein CANTEDRAFT_95131 [Yamadazyma tenuis ATCC 10573]EGV62241.1 hypothetical protein CANTEDRAFT_95131 [Yamadazyma tenuis ATCC 10573]